MSFTPGRVMAQKNQTPGSKQESIAQPTVTQKT
jgi:hypothetical protein